MKAMLHKCGELLPSLGQHFVQSNAHLHRYIALSTKRIEFTSAIDSTAACGHSPLLLRGAPFQNISAVQHASKAAHFSVGWLMMPGAGARRVPYFEINTVKFAFHRCSPHSATHGRKFGHGQTTIVRTYIHARTCAARKRMNVNDSTPHVR